MPSPLLQGLGFGLGAGFVGRETVENNLAQHSVSHHHNLNDSRATRKSGTT